jgi:hypothetical protein
MPLSLYQRRREQNDDVEDGIFLNLDERHSLLSSVFPEKGYVFLLRSLFHALCEESSESQSELPLGWI